VIAAAELLAPAYLVEGEDSPDEAEEYVEVDNINPAQYYKVGRGEGGETHQNVSGHNGLDAFG
jgi:hypothetical protein